MTSARGRRAVGQEIRIASVARNTLARQKMGRDRLLEQGVPKRVCIRLDGQQPRFHRIPQSTAHVLCAGGSIRGKVDRIDIHSIAETFYRFAGPSRRSQQVVGNW